MLRISLHVCRPGSDSRLPAAVLQSVDNSAHEPGRTGPRNGDLLPGTESSPGRPGNRHSAVAAPAVSAQIGEKLGFAAGISGSERRVGPGPGSGRMWGRRGRSLLAEESFHHHFSGITADRARRSLLLDMQIPNNFGVSRGHEAAARVCLCGESASPQSSHIHLPGPAVWEINSRFTGSS